MPLQPYIRYTFYIIGILLFQTMFLPFIGVGGYFPDLYILLIVYLALRRGQIEVTVTGFCIGLLQDIVTTKFFGLAALSKTVCAFVVGYFFNENTTEQTLGTYRYVLLTALCSLVHNVLYFFIFFQGSEGSIFALTLEMTFGTTLYTVVVAVLPMFFFSRRYNISWAQ
jgi:rod shape-determining protein MreD